MGATTGAATGVTIGTTSGSGATNPHKLRKCTFSSNKAEFSSCKKRSAVSA
jgi:hypothetical protein